MGDYYFDPGITVKEEPTNENTLNVTASVPIPLKRLDLGDYRLIIDFESPNSPNYQDMLANLQSPEPLDSNSLWDSKISPDMDVAKSEQSLQMDDDDDIFQVDKADLIHGPTLAELNANDDNLLADLNFDDLLLPEESTLNYLNSMSSSQYNQKFSSPLFSFNNNNNSGSLFATSCPQSGIGFYKDLDFVPANFTQKTIPPTFSPKSQTSSNSSLVYQSVPSPISPLQQKHSTLHELLKRSSHESPDRSAAGTSITGITPTKMQKVLHSSRLSSSAPTHLGMEQIWQRREPRQHLLSTGSLAEAGSTSSISTGGVLSPEAHDFSYDEMESDEDSDKYEDFSSDNGDSDDEEYHHPKSGSKKERFFWQYNVQAKGPKGQRLILKTKTENPHVLNEITDPVFSVDCAVRGIKHSGKARKGDGNDLTPNPRKLYSIGKELDKLGKIINDMTPVSELPFNVRPKTRKEKNKLASRACRLKKKAQHEANKIKLQGLETEHRRLMNGISQVKQIFAMKLSSSDTTENKEELSKHMEKVMKSATKVKIAGVTTEYVNKILEKMKMGGVNITMEDCM